MIYRVVGQNPLLLKTEPQIYMAPVSHVNETFDINVTINNLEASQKLVGVHFRLGFNNSLIEVLHVTEGPFLGMFNQTSTLPYTFFISYVEENGLYGPHILVGTLLLPNATGGYPGPFPEGNGTIATITLKQIYQPIYPDPSASCKLKFLEVKLLDSDGNHILVETEDGEYRVIPLSIPSLMIEPASHNASKRGEIFNFTVDIQNLQRQWCLLGIHFRLSYDPSLLQILSVTEGPFLQQFNQTPTPPYTFFISYVEENGLYGPHILVGTLLLPNATGGYPGPFPEGNGTIATITLKATGQPTIVPEPPANCTLEFIEVKLLNDLGEELPFSVTSGYYEIPALLYPVAQFYYQPAFPSFGEVVIFNASESYDPDYEISVYSWDFGDGTIINTTEPIVSHVYSQSGTFNVTLTVIDIDELSANMTKTLSISYYKELTINIDVGSIHFAGELTDFYILVSSFGKPTDATSIKALLYYDGTLFADLTNVTQHVSTGLYRVAYEIPAEAKPGTYTLVIEAEYYTVKGTNLKSFLVSQTLSGFVTDITQGIATVSNGLTEVKVNLTAINAKLVSIEGNLATISTTLGAIDVKLDAIDAKIVGVNGTVATISTTLGEANVKLGDVQSIATTALYVTSILSALGVILAAAILIFIRKK